MTNFHLFASLGFISIVVVGVAIYIVLMRSRLRLLSEQQLRLEQVFNDFSDAVQRTLRNNDRAQAVEIETLRNQLSDQSDAVNQLTEQLRKLQSKVQEFEFNDPEIKLYQQAKKLVASGASVEEVMDSCQLTRAEVDLLYSLENANRTD